MKDQEALPHCPSQVSLSGKYSCRGWASQLGTRLCWPTHRCPCCYPHQTSICSQATGEGSQQQCHRVSESPWSSWRGSEWRSQGSLRRSTWPKRTGQHTNTWNRTDWSVQNEFRMKEHNGRIEIAVLIEWCWWWFLPYKQGSVDPLYIDITSHDWCRPNILIDIRIRMTVSHDWRNGVYGAEWGSFLQVPTVDDKQVDPRAHAIHSFRLWRSNLLLRIHPTRLTSSKHKWSCLHTCLVRQQWLESNESLTPIR